MSTSAQGEDRSSFQAVLPPVDRNGKRLDFVIYKATEGVDFVDRNYASNIAQAKASGVPFGSYHFLHPSLSIPQQIALFMATVAEQGGLVTGAILVVDSEIMSGAGDRMMLLSDRSHLLIRDPVTNEANIRDGVSYPHHLLSRDSPTRISATLVDSATREFIVGVRTAVEVALGGDYCQEMVYSFLAMLHQLSSCTPFPLWVADFTNTAPTTVSPWHDWAIWQYAGGGGNGGSDQDGFNGSVTDFAKWRGSKMPPPVVKPPIGTDTISLDLPRLGVGSIDKPGAVGFVMRAQSIISSVGNRNRLPNTAVAPDGDFGPKTEAALKEIQHFAGLSPTGSVGAAEWKFLYAGVFGA